MKGKHSISSLIRHLTLFSAYFLTGIFGLKLAAVSGLATSVWAPSGIALACLLKFGLRFWPSIFFAAFAVNNYMGASIYSAFFIGIGNTLEAVAAFYLLNKFCKGSVNLYRLSHIVYLLIFGAGLSTLISAFFGVANLWLTSMIPDGLIGFTFLTWWFGDAMGILLVTTPILIWSLQEGLRDWISPERLLMRSLELLTLVILLIAASYFIFVNKSVNIEILRPHFIFPLLIWGAIRFDQRGATLAFFIVSVIAIWATANGLGPFAIGERVNNLLNLQGFMSIVTISALILGAIITERRKAEDLLHENARELARSNSDLQQFASMASHDLQEPLRTISIRLQLLEEHLGEKKDAEVEEQINFCIGATRRMQSLIVALLNYARVGKSNVHLSPVDLNTEIQKVLEMMQEEITLTKASIKVDRLPIIIGNRLLLGQVFQNLLSNALKFRNNTDPIIQIGYKDHSHEFHFFVKDNGIGFSSAHAESIFKIFNRLHSDSEVAGSGIGLALCKKIVLQHAGRIWAESEPGKGSTFYFTIPKKAI